MHVPRRSAVGRIACACAEALEFRQLLSVSLVADINTGNQDGATGVVGTLGGTVYISGTPAGGGLYASDGTTAGTQLITSPVLPISMFQLSSGETFLAGFNALWATNGALSDAQKIADFFVGGIMEVGGKAIFGGPGAADPSQRQFWESDGTAAGTRPLNFLPSNISAAAGIGGKLVYNTLDTSTFPPVSQVFATDGTAGGTISLSGPISGGVNIVTAGASGYFASDQGGVWRTDGTPAGTSQVWAISNGPVYFPGVTPGGAALFNGNFPPQAATAPLFLANPSVHQVGSVLLQSQPVTAGSRYLFLGQSGQQAGLWSTDGTSAGTVLLKPVSESNITSVSLTQGESTVFFDYDDGIHGFQLWKTDGTQAGTGMVADINPTGDAVDARTRTFVNGNLFFIANDGLHGYELWKSDGTAAGTSMVKDLNVAPASSNPVDLSDVNGKLYFTASERHGTQPWTSDGTAAGTQLLADVYPPVGPLPGPYIGTAGKAFFVDSSNQLWSTDSTAAGTTKLVTLDTPTAPLNQQAFGVLQDKLVFGSFDDQDLSSMLWISDGTVAGTQVLKNGIGPGDHFEPVSGGLEFWSSGGVWRTDGTPAGTTKIGTVPDFASLSGFPSFPSVQILAPVGFLNGNYYVGVEIAAPFRPPPSPPPPPPVYQLWRIGPTGNLKLQQFPSGLDSGVVNLNGTMVFIADGTLYREDGLPPILLPLATLPTANGNSPPQLTVSGSHAFFVAGDQLWITDATVAGTRPVAQFSPGATISDLTAANGAVFFNVNRQDLWVSDGTADGTAPLAHFDPVPWYDQGLRGLTASGSHVFFAAADATHNRELWAADVAGSISGSVFNDANHNGLQDPGESGLAGVTVYLDANNNGVLDPGEPSAVTGQNGTYTFAGLQSGAGVVREVLPAGWRRTTPPADSATTVVHPALASAGPVFGDVQVSTVPMNFDFLLTLAQHYGQQGTFATGDVTGDGQVNFDDLLLVAQNYGHSLPAATMTADGSSLLLKRKNVSRPRRQTPGNPSVAEKL